MSRSVERREIGACDPFEAPLIERRLDNGLRLLMQVDRRLPLVAIDLWYHVGSRHDPPGRSGLAHLFEHMLFQGSKHVGANEHFARVQQVGGVANGSTWYDRTNYYETLPSHAMELGFWLESDRMGFLLEALDEQKLELQRRVVMNERRQRVDNQPYGRGSERLNELLYADHPYASPVIGWMHEIERISMSDLRRFFGRYYAPGNATLVVVGDIEPEPAEELVRRYFEPLQNREGDSKLDDAGKLELTGTEAIDVPVSEAMHEVVEDEVATARVQLAWTVPGYGTPAWYACSIVAGVLAQGKSSRLYRRLVRDLELATGVRAYVLPTECCATFSIVASARPGADVAALRRELLAQTEELRAGGCLEEEVTRVTACAAADQRFALQSTQGRADAIARGATYLDEPARAFDEHHALLDAASDPVLTAAADRLVPERAVGVTVTPVGEAT